MRKFLVLAAPAVMLLAAAPALAIEPVVITDPPAGSEAFTPPPSDGPYVSPYASSQQGNKGGLFGNSVHFSVSGGNDEGYSSPFMPSGDQDPAFSHQQFHDGPPGMKTDMWGAPYGDPNWH